ncbi:hypothetical protein FHX09_000458 [Rhizobium sp. BK538]|nr:hypothetical protein [Rhizobium sp. BK060]MBB4166643.1 hypothetical protein [Rhizobium sp. BK538]TCM67610.1 hypothetical protein EV291_13317 [Rhizobium sp. BK068]
MSTWIFVDPGENASSRAVNTIIEASAICSQLNRRYC